MCQYPWGQLESICGHVAQSGDPEGQMRYAARPSRLL